VLDRLVVHAVRLTGTDDGTIYEFDEAMMNTCFACHQQTKARDLVFTRYAR